MENFCDEQTRERIGSQEGSVSAVGVGPSYNSRVWIAMALLMLGSFGCGGQHSSAVSPGSAELVASPSPEKIYKEIMVIFRRQVEGVTTDPSRSRGSVFTTKMERTVKDELIPPATATDHYKAQITVDTRLNSTYRSTVDDKEEEDGEDGKKKKSKVAGQVGIEDPFSDTDPDRLDDFDESVRVRTSQGRLKDLVKPVVTERVSEYEDTFELEFKDGRWILAEQHEELSPYFQDIFDHVLSRQ